MKRTLIILCYLAASASASVFAGQIDLPKNESGWTIFTPSADSTIVYVADDGNDSTCVGYLPDDALVGPDPFSPVGDIQPCLTYAAAYAKTHANMPDWILLKRGSVFNERIYGNHRNGRSSTEPFLISAYGSSGALPIITLPSAYDTMLYVNGSRQWLAISGVDLYASVRDPESVDYIDGTNRIGINFYAGSGAAVQGILIEGCRLRFFKEHILTNNGAALFSDIKWRRNTFLDNYSGSTAHSQGIYATHVNSMIIEENIFDHNGWLVQNDGDASEEEGEATIYNHSLYLSYCNNIVVRNNVISRSSSNAVKLDNDELPALQNATIIGNLIVDNNIGIGVNDGDTDYDYRAYNTTITNNVFSHLGASNTTNGEIAWAFYTRDLDVATITGNLMLSQNNEAITNVKFFELWGGCRGVNFNGNIAYGNKNLVGLYLRAGGTKEVSISNNYIQSLESSGRTIVAGDASNNIDSALSGYTLSANKYYTNRDLNDRITLNDAVISDATWFSNTGDSSAFESVAFPDASRSLETYMQGIGETASLAGFTAKIRLQDRYSWDTRFSAQAVNNFLRAGFGMGGGRFRVRLSQED